jgi:predicted ATPase/DNA-binding SARP family transcriptional activator
LRHQSGAAIIAVVERGATTGLLRFRVLGPLEAWCEDRPLRLGGERQRALLALLVLRANELLTIDQLVEERFGGEPSDAAINAVRAAVSRLRRALEDRETDGTLVTRQGGYVLRADPEQLDALVFERLLAQGQTLMTDGHPHRAAACLREALALWRGPALADLALVECLQAEVRRLDELRLVARMELVDADLELGRASQLIAELEALVSANPLQERLRAQLMRALYQAGRQADALAVYRQTSELLREELGLEPSRHLQDIEQSILQHDLALQPANPVAAAPHSNLPRPATAFVGRAAELAEVTAMLQHRDARLVTLTGAGGSGKTRLALGVAEACSHRYADGVRFVDFSDITDPELIASTICAALELREQPDVPAAEALARYLRARRLLLVLDNLEQLIEGTRLLAGLLASSPGLSLLVTSREPLRLAGEIQYDVPVLQCDDAVALLRERVQAVAPRVSVDAALAGRICERVDYLPLAVELAAARAKAFSPAEILSRLDERLPLLTGGPRDAPRRQHTLGATIGWSYELLGDAEQRLFARLAVFAGGFTLTGAEAVSDAHLDTLQALLDRSLIVRDGERYAMLQTIREYALGRLLESGEADFIHLAHARWLTGLLESEGLTPPWWPNRTSLRRMAQERENFTAALEWASKQGAIEILARLSALLTGVWIMRGQLHEASRWLALALAHQHELPASLAAQLLSAARSLAHHSGDHANAAAFTAQALALWRELGDIDAIAREMISVGSAAHSADDPAAARLAMGEAITFARENDLTEALAVALNNLGDLAIQEGKLDEGQSLGEEALTVAAAGSISAGIAQVNLAHLMMLKGRPRDALALSHHALESALAQGDLLLVAWAAIGHAWSLAALNDVDRSGRLLGSATRFIQDAGATHEWMDIASANAANDILTGQLGTQEAQALIDEGAGRQMEEAAAEELALLADKTH